MATNYEHTNPFSGSECARRTLLANVANPAATQMASTEVHCSTDGAGRVRFFRAAVNIGRTYFLGSVATEAEMLALDQAGLAQGACLPGDWCYRSDTGLVMRCISGYGTTLADWQTDPATSALIASIAGKIGSSSLDGYATTAETTAAISDAVAALEVELGGKVGSATLSGYVPTTTIDTSADLSGAAQQIPTVAGLKQYVTANAGGGGDFLLTQVFS